MVVRVRNQRQRRGAALRALRTVGDLRVAAALLFAAALAAPRAPLVYHRHAGGTQAHVHADAGLLALLGLGEAAAHRHAGAAPDPRPAYARDSGAAGGHVHQQPRYHAAVVVSAAFLAVGAPLAPLPARSAGHAPTRSSGAPTARGPPLSVVG